MTETAPVRRHVTIRLIRQRTVDFDAANLWPLRGAYSRFGADLVSLPRR
jgi:hypothetical protein